MADSAGAVAPAAAARFATKSAFQEVPGKIGKFMKEVNTETRYVGQTH